LAGRHAPPDRREEYDAVTDVSLTCLSWLNLFVADMQTGFGPFVSVRLTIAGWDPGRIGAVLSVATIAAILTQVPAGMLVDRIADKRRVAAAGILGSMFALLVIATQPGFLPVLGAEVVQGAAGPTLTLSIAAITLALTSHEALGERLGRNVRFGAIGAALGAVLLGLVGSSISPGAVFIAAMLFGSLGLLVLTRIRAPAPALLPQAAPAAPPPQRTGVLLRDRRLLAFIACVAAFHLASAAQLPLAATGAARQADELADLVTGAALTVPQILVAAVSPWVGRMANRRGRRFVLLVGFSALPARALLFALSPAPVLVVLVQALDGVSGAVFGVLLPLVIADITRKSGHFNFALGIASVAIGLGAAASNALGGAVADFAGLRAAFLTLAGIGVGATALVWLVMPETMHLAADQSPPHVANAPLTPDPA
jgi:MFS family permease